MSPDTPTTPAITFPISTYRLHLTSQFTLHDAADMVDYIDRLGVDWMYASPIQTVPAGATHGYHITDPDRVNPELGGEEALSSLHGALTRHGRGLVLDIVPNHLGATPDNAWWTDVLTHGRDSAYAGVFDIDFDAGPIVLPVLGEPVDHAIAAGSLAIEGGRLTYHDLVLPLAPDTDVAAPIEQVLSTQHYQLHEWRHGETILNWRRFFAINELAGVRIEDPAVFDLIHATILGWVQAGVVQGLRVDHIDGLRDPSSYLTTLRHRLGVGRWLVVEKIVESDEHLPADWPVQGTTGYEVNALLQAWQIDSRGYRQLRRAFRDTTRDIPSLSDTSTAEALPESKLAALDELFVAEVARVVELLQDVTAGPGERAPSTDSLRRGVRYLTAHLAGYRTYAGADGPISPSDQAAIDLAATAASHAGTPEAQDVAAALLTKQGRPALLRWQQLTGPAAAKGFEDRLLFRHVALSGLGEVGADAQLLDGPPDAAAVQARMAYRAANWPAAGTTTSTHDTKRGEDVRGRLTVLAEMPDAFTQLLADVSATLPELDGHARWLLLQTVVGSFGLEPDDADGNAPSDSYRARLDDYAEKALREAAVHTSHRDPNQFYERQVDAWLNALLQPGDAFQAVTDMVDRIAVPGACNSLATVVLKVAAPGVPDIYRGCEVWDGSLVDPDNRRALDIQRFRGLLDGLNDADPLAVRDRWHDGALKMLVTRQALQARRRLPEVFGSVICRTPDTRGVHQDHVMVLQRHATDSGPWGTADAAGLPKILAVATRLPWALAGDAWPIGHVWGDTAIRIGDGHTGAVDLLTDTEIPISDGWAHLAEAATVLPVLLLELTNE
ncbi:malto-oligosyltrehalose synthase [soil metagenome]